MMPSDRRGNSTYLSHQSYQPPSSYQTGSHYTSSSYPTSPLTVDTSSSQFGDAYRPSMLPKICASKSKKEFFNHLGLSETDERDRRLYRDMMDEAAVARERLCSNPFNLTAQHRMNPNLKPPYSSAMFMESALFEEVKAIYHAASPQTKYYYNKGIYQEGSNIDNWVIRWCLWHVFRYRDDRNRNRSHRGSYYPVVNDGTDEYQVGESSTSPGIYDPVRNVFRY